MPKLALNFYEIYPRSLLLKKNKKVSFRNFKNARLFKNFMGNYKLELLSYPRQINHKFKEVGYRQRWCRWHGV